MENKQLNLSEPENIMGTMDVNPLLIKLSIPMMISMLVQALYNVVDSIFVARPPLAVVVAVAQNVGRAQKHPTHEAALFFGPSGPAGITQPWSFPWRRQRPGSS